MAANSQSPSFEPFRLFSSPEENNSSSLRLGLFDSPPAPTPPAPPCLEVLASETSTSVKYTVEPVDFGGLSLLKGRVSTQEVFSLSNSDLVPGKYEGGLKLWEGSLDLIKAVRAEIQTGHLSFTGKRVLELGCGHGLPGILACLQGAAAVHFQDFNAEVLRCLTIPNVNANIENEDIQKSTNVSKCETNAEIRFFAGDWAEVHKLLPLVPDSENDLENNLEQRPVIGYDVILMAETVYSISALQSLYELIKKSLSRPHGVVFMAAKKYYFGVGGGTRRFLAVVERDGVMASSLVAEVADGSSNVREVWKLSFK